MGQEVISALNNHGELTLGVAVQREMLLSPQRLADELAKCDVIIDFTTAQAQPLISSALSQIEIALPFITGVTGIGEPESSWLAHYAQRAPVFWAANFSVGVALLKRLSVLAAQALGASFDAEIYELHHRHKLDAPSGTARVLAEAICEGRRLGGTDEPRVSYTPTSPRNSDVVQVSAGRGGGVFGDHSVFFLGDSERVELKHSALNRQVFASGALRAAEWCLHRAPGLYSMDHLWED
jgi:4-hydroxy-tetrahydrodipicolinate reductase